MVKGQHARILLNIDAARRDERYSTEQVEAAYWSLQKAAILHRRRMAARRATTRREIEKFSPTLKPWRGYFLLDPAS